MSQAHAKALDAFRQGCRAPWDGFVFLWRHPKLWRHAVVPVLLSVVISLVVLAGLVGAAVWFAIYLHPRFPPQWYGWVLEALCALALLVVAAALSFGVFLLLKGCLCDYSNARLAEQVEFALGFRKDDATEVPFLHHVADSVRDLLFLAGVNLGLLVLHLIPVLGSIAGLCGSFYFSCLTFGEDYLDHPMALRGMRRGDKRAWVRAHRAETVGLGAIALAGTLVPLLGAVVLSSCAIGAVLLYRRIEGQR